MSADKLIDRLPHPSGTDTTESTEVSQAESDTEHMARTTAGPQTTENTRTLYSAALILKQLLCDSPGMTCDSPGMTCDSPGMTCPWPPTSVDLNVSDAKSVVPLELYNVIAWIVGATEETTLACYVDIPEYLNLKVISVCQDIMYLASKGRRQTPK